MTPDEIQSYVDNRIEACLEEVAQKAADKALEKVYAQIGRGVFYKLVWLLGAATIALIFWLAGKGIIKP